MHHLLTAFFGKLLVLVINSALFTNCSILHELSNHVSEQLGFGALE